MAEEQKPGNFRPLRSITRLLIGGILLASEALDGQLRDWDESIKEPDPARSEGDVQAGLQVEPLPETLPSPQVGLPPQRNDYSVRYALIGLIFEGEEKFDEALTAGKRIGGLADRVFNPLFRPIQKLGTLRSVQKRFDLLTNLGQSEVDRWINRGREEETLSRQLTQQAAASTVDQSILYMAENEAVTELIQTQGVSLSRQILELVRAISVSADYFIEGLARHVLRRRPRYLLPPPSQEVQEQATWTLQEFRHEDE